MVILWFANMPIPKIAEKIGIKSSPSGGWLIRYAEHLSKEFNIKFHYAFPLNKIINGDVDNIFYHSFNIDTRKFEKKHSLHETQIEELIEKIKPDIIHIHG